MNTFHLQHHQNHASLDSTRWSFNHRPSSAGFYARLAAPPPPSSSSSTIQTFPGLDDDDLVAAVVPPVTVVLEGRSICHRINLQSHASYQSLARALRQMFVDGGSSSAADVADNALDLSNAVPGHLIAYEDMENDLLLAGDLNWKDFVRVARRIRIMPAKRNSRRVIEAAVGGGRRGSS